MKKIVLILFVAINSMVAHAQINGSDTLTESRRNEIIFKVIEKKFLNEGLVKRYSVEDTPTITDMGIWQESDTAKLNIRNWKPLIGRRLHAVIYPSSEESLKYYPNTKNMVILIDVENSLLLYVRHGITRMAVKNMKEHCHMKDSLNLLRLKYLEKEKRMKEIEDSIKRENGGQMMQN